MEDIYVVLGATGNTGRPVAERLLEAGKKVAVIARNENKLKELTGKGAKAFTGNILDANFLKNAFSEASAVYAMIPPDYSGNDYRTHYAKSADSIVNALKNSNVKHVVALSSVGAELTEGTGVVVGLHEFEEKLKTLSGINILMLRAAYFMENFYGSMDMIRNMGILGSATKGDIPIPMVSAKDISEVAAAHLIKLDFNGISVQYVLGQRNLTFNDTAKILGRALGKDDLKYTQFSYDDAKKGLIQAGLPEDTADGFVGLSKYFNSGMSEKEVDRTPANTTPTSLEEFAETYARVYNSKK